MLRHVERFTVDSVVALFKETKKDEWIKGDENDDAAFSHPKHLLISLWSHPQGFELRYGYQAVAVVNEPGGDVVFLKGE